MPKTPKIQPTNQLGVHLKALLTASKLSENELARRTGISQQIINRILSGQNKNPKLATLIPIANYFMISLSQLVGESALPKDIHTNPIHLGWEEIPLLEWEELKHASIESLLTLPHQKIWIDRLASKHMFAVLLKGHEMEPKFSEGTILIFNPEKPATHLDFILYRNLNKELLFRQFWRQNNISYQKALNPNYPDHQLSPMDEYVHYLGALIQSRTNYPKKVEIH